ncbi:MAG: copper chaperone PCu(A)C [Balneolaceae bacterium]
MKSLNTLFSLVIGLLFFLTSCSGGKTEQAEIQQEEIMVERVRPAQEGGTTAAYFTYKNELETTDTLLSVSSEVAGMSQVHESYLTDDGMMGMREQKNLAVEAGESLNFAQGGLHVMLMQLKENLQVGDTVTLKMQFKNKGLVEKLLPVRTY